MDNQAILQSSAGPVLTLTLNRPQVRNAFNITLAQALETVLQQVAEDGRCRVVVIRGAGGAFSAGGDLKLFHEQLKKGETHFQQVFRHINGAIHLIRTMPQPVVAAIRGPAYAAGLGLALSCDLAVASHNSSLSPSFVNVALAPNAASTFFLPRLIGVRAATEAFMRGKVFSASEALDLGILNHVWGEEVFEEELAALLEDLAGRPAGTLARIKYLMNTSLAQTWQDQLELEKEEIALSSLNPDFREGVEAFVKKRRPKFK